MYLGQSGYSDYTETHASYNKSVSRSFAEVVSYQQSSHPRKHFTYINHQFKLNLQEKKVWKRDENFCNNVALGSEK